MMDYHRALDESFARAEQGRLAICSLIEHNGVREDTCWVILPTDDEELNRLATGSILRDYITAKRYVRTIVIARDDAAVPEDAMCDVDGCELVYRRLAPEDLDAVLSYYRLVQFAPDVIVVSLEEPYSFSKWIGHFGISLEQFVRDALFFGRPINWLWWEIDWNALERSIRENVPSLAGHSVFLYGCTRLAPYIHRMLGKFGISVAGLVDSDPKKEGWNSLLELESQLPEHALVPYNPDARIIVVPKYAREMRIRLQSIGYGPDQVVEVAASGGIHAPKGVSREALDEEFRKVVHGVEVRESLGREMAIVCQSGTGDVYYTCALLPAFQQASGVDEFTLVVHDSPSCVKVAELFGIKNVRPCSLEDIASLYKAWELLGSDSMSMRPVLNLGSRLPRCILPHLESGESPTWLHWLNCMKYQYFPFEGQKELVSPPHTLSIENVAHYESLGLRKGRTVLLSPYANAFSSSLVNTAFWENVAIALMQRGYDVVANCAPGEAPIPGVASVCIPYSEIIGFLEYAGHFIAIRSGLCDVVGSARQCHMVIIFEKSVGVRREMWSLKKMGLQDDCVDLVYDGDPDELERLVLEEFGFICDDA